MKHEFTCSQCSQYKTYDSEYFAGYAKDDKGNIICYDCCGLNDADRLEKLKPKEKFTLYMNTKEKTLTNWPGTLKIIIPFIKEGSHNIAGKRYDTWFIFNCKQYHAVKYGDNTQIAHIKRVASSYISTNQLLKTT